MAKEELRGTANYTLKISLAGSSAEKQGMQPKTSIGRDFQDSILHRLADRHQVTTIYLRNRMALRGWIREFDPYVLLLEPLDGGPPQMVYKSAIVSISGPPSRRPRPRSAGEWVRGSRPPHGERQGTDRSDGYRDRDEQSDRREPGRPDPRPEFPPRPPRTHP